MRLLIVTQYFPPEMGAPQARLSELAKRLKAMGHEITILTGMPNYPTGRVFKDYRGKLRMEETVEGLRVIRTCLYPSKSSRLVTRLLSYLSFAASALLLGQWGIGRQDIVMIESPPPFLFPAGMIIAKLKRAKPLMMVADIWPEILVQMGNVRAGAGLKAMYALEKFCYNHAAAVALTTPGMCASVRKRFPHVQVVLLSNGADTSLFTPDKRDERVRAELGATSDQFLIGYCGLHGLAQGLEIILDAADRLRERRDIQFVLIGDGPTKERLLARARDLNLTNLRMLDQRPKSSMPPIVASLDVSLMPLSVRIPGAMPSKVYEALAAGAVPLVAKGSDADALLTQARAGLSYEPGDLNEFVDRVVQLADDRAAWREMRERAIKLAQRFDRNVLAAYSARVLTAVAAGQKPPDISW